MGFNITNNRKFTVYVVPILTVLIIVLSISAMSKIPVSQNYEYKVVNIANLIALNNETLMMSNNASTTDPFQMVELLAVEIENKLNEMGSNGWELVSTSDNLYIMKRVLN